MLSSSWRVQWYVGIPRVMPPSNSLIVNVEWPLTYATMGVLLFIILERIKCNQMLKDVWIAWWSDQSGINVFTVYLVSSRARINNRTLPCIFMHTRVLFNTHDDVIKWKLFPRYRPLVWGIHRFQVNSPHTVMRTLMFLWCGSAL